MTDLHFGCSFTDLWASPSNWKTTTSKLSLKKDWYIQCYFYDPKFREQYPKGFTFRRRFNKIKSLEGRKAAIELALNELPKLFIEKGYNPITGTYILPEENASQDNEFLIEEYSPETPLIKALNLAFYLKEYSSDTSKDVKSVLNYFKQSCVQLRIENMQVGKVLNLHIKLVMDNMHNVIENFSDKRYNKYLAYLSALFEKLPMNMITHNPVTKVDRKKTITEARITMTIKERKTVSNFLSANFPRFWLFMVIFFHSGGREIELLNVKLEHVDLDNLQYKAVIKKGGQYKWVYRPIKKIAVDYWQKAMIGAKKGDYLFSVGLLPGERPIRRDQITRRWRVHVKQKLGIKADFYAMKHINLDEITARSGLKAAAKAAGHVNTKMVESVYAVGEKDRAMQLVKDMDNEFVPRIKKLA